MITGLSCFAKDHSKGALGLLLLMVILSEALRLAPVFLLSTIIKALESPGFYGVMGPAALLLVLAGAYLTLHSFGRRYGLMLILKSEALLKMRWFSCILSKDYSFFASKAMGEVMSSFDRGARSYYEMLCFLTDEMLRAAIRVFITVVYVSVHGGLWMVFFMVVGGVLSALVQLWFLVRRTPLLRQLHGVSDDVSADQEELLSAIKTIQSVGDLPGSVASLKISFEKLRRLAVKNAFLGSWMESLRNLYPAIFSAVILLSHGSMSVFDQQKTGLENYGVMEVGVFVALFWLIKDAMGDVVSLMMCFEESHHYVLAQEPFKKEVLDSSKHPIPDKRSHSSVSSLSYHLTLRPFKHPFGGSKDQFLVNPKPIEIAPGDKVMVMGASGQGKSTLAALITGMRSCRGLVFLGGVDVGSLSESVLSKYVHYGESEILFLKGNFSQALMYGLDYDESQLSDETLEKLGLLAKKSELVSGDVPFSYWSQGEKKRLTLLRAYLLSPPVILLDEPTESLSEKEKRELWPLIFTLFDDRTLICITHDESFRDFASHHLRLFEIVDHKLDEV